jgi:ABC-type sugar transport system permease subunit
VESKAGDRAAKAGRTRPFGLLSARDVAIFLALPATVYGVLFLLPNVFSLFMAFTNWSTHLTSIEFVGLRNFGDLWADGSLSRAISATFRYAIVVTVVQNGGAFLLALALERATRFNIAARTILFLPVLISGLAAGYIFKGVFDPAGVLNQGLAVVTGQPVRAVWLGSLDFTLYVVALVHAWKFMGLAALIYIAGLISIPKDLLDAAKIDGANEWQVIRRIKIPLIAPALTFNLSLTIIGTLSAFDLILAMTRGGPGFSTEVLNLVIQRLFQTGSFGYATAASVVLVALVLIVAVPTILILRRREVEL